MVGTTIMDGPQQRWLKGLVNAIQGGVVIADDRGRPDYVSLTARDLLGCVDDAACAEIWASIHERIAANRSGATEYTVDVAVDAGGRNLDLRAEVISLRRGELGYVAILHSRRQLRAVESDLRLADRMRGIMTLYRTMVHDLKAPLNVIVVSLDSLHRSLTEGREDEEGIQEQQLRHLRTLQTELTRLQRTLQAYLDQTGGGYAEQASFDFRRLTREVMVLLGPQADQQKVELEMRMTERPVHVFGYRDQLKQVVFNLAMNALEAMSEGGRLTIDLEADGSRMRLRVEDTGPGIAPELMDRVFEMHVTTKPDGSGIGLFVARATIADHGGAIRLESELGRGTMAEIELPLVQDVGRQ